jgi:hypothetical protein
MIRLKRAAMIAGVFLAAAFSAPVWADPVLSISPVSSTVSAGGTAKFDVNITGAVDLAAFGFDLVLANPNAASITSVAEGTFLSGGGTTIFAFLTVDNATTTVGDALTGSGPGVNGDGLLATFTLSGLTAGTSSIDFANVLLLDSTLTAIPNVTTTSGRVTVNSNTAVPEPSSKLLLLAGLSALALLAIKKHSA